jgi:putative N6-adenine-specific DNA methylase
VKDAIVDQFMEKSGKRPSIRLENPDLYINVHISNTTCTISLDSSGDSLHKRGYRASQTDAPLNEILAAGMLLLAGWDGQCDFIDPMCGSGTLLTEAAMIALNIPPGLYRNSFAFEKWDNFDKDLFDRVYNDETGEREFNFHIYGSDNSPKAIRTAEMNIKSAGLGKYISLQQCRIQELEKPAEKGMIVTNPPYGERLQGDDLYDLYGDIGERLKHHFQGYTAWVISSERSLLSNIGLRPSKKIPLLNSSLECEFWKFELFEGKRKEFKARKD